MVVGVGNEFKNDTNIQVFGILDTRVSDVGWQDIFHIQYICFQLYPVVLPMLDMDTNKKVA